MEPGPVEERAEFGLSRRGQEEFWQFSGHSQEREAHLEAIEAATTVQTHHVALRLPRSGDAVPVVPPTGRVSREGV